jgi:hypothetical protein
MLYQRQKKKKKKTAKGLHTQTIKFPLGLSTRGAFGMQNGNSFVWLNAMLDNNYSLRDIMSFPKTLKKKEMKQEKTQNILWVAGHPK